MGDAVADVVDGDFDIIVVFYLPVCTVWVGIFKLGGFYNFCNKFVQKLVKIDFGIL